MSCDNVDNFRGSKPDTRRQQRLPVSPTGGPVLLPNLSPGPTLDEQLGSPVFRDALQAAKENRSNDYPSSPLLRFTLSPDPLLPSHQATYSYGTHDSKDPTRRMQTHVAVRDNLESPHRFQIIPLHKAKLCVPAQPKPLAPSHKLSTSREKHKIPVAPESHRWSASLALMPVSNIHRVRRANPLTLCHVDAPVWSREFRCHSIRLYTIGYIQLPATG